MYRTSQIRRFAISLLLFAAFAAGVIYFGFDLAGGVARGAPAVAAGSPGDAAAAARSGGGRWGPSHGPEGGPAFALAVAPSAPEIVYVGTGRGVFRSMNGGRSWASAGLAQPPGPDGSRPGRHFARRRPANAENGVRRSQRPLGRAGRRIARRCSRARTAGRPGALSIYEVSLSRSVPRGLRPSTQQPAGLGGTSRLFRSTDGGRSWQPADRGLPSTISRGRSPLTRRRRRPSMRRWAGVESSRAATAAVAGTRWASLRHIGR